LKDLSKIIHGNAFVSNVTHFRSSKNVFLFGIYW